jgi:2-haloacid dehalogenase
MTERLQLVVLDVNETLSDLTPMRERFASVGLPEEAAATWFASVLRDGFALAAMGRAAPFAEIGATLLRGRLAAAGLPAGEDQVSAVLTAFRELPLHPDVGDGLRLLRDAGLRVVTLTNGGTPVPDSLLSRAGLRDLVETLLSVDDAGIWKPAAGAYAYAAQATGIPAERSALVAVHPWDVAGAQAGGLVGAWVDRTGDAYPPYFPEPDVKGRIFVEVAEALVARS